MKNPRSSHEERGFVFVSGKALFQQAHSLNNKYLPAFGQRELAVQRVQAGHVHIVAKAC